MKPEVVSDLDLAFPASVSRLMPEYKDIPEEFKDWNSKWHHLVAGMFFHGGKITKMVTREGIDGDAAMRHIKCILGSFEPKHEHKMAACAFLISEWFSEFEFQAGDGK